MTLAIESASCLDITYTKYCNEDVEDVEDDWQNTNGTEREILCPEARFC